jgi:hypothetical protein
MATVATYIKIPKLNPLRWLKYANNTRDDFFTNEISDYEQPEKYSQKFCPLDPIGAQIQILTAKVPLYKMELVDTYGNVVATAAATVMHTDSTTGYSYIHFTLLCPSVTGCYFAKMTITFDNGYMYIPEVYYSEPLQIAATHPGTIIIDYSHDENDYGFIFQKSLLGLAYSGLAVVSPSTLYRIRVEGGLWMNDKNTGTSDDIYIDDSHNSRLLNSIPYNIYTWTIGNARGIPQWLMDKIVRVFSCAFVKINGTYYTKNDGAAFDIQTTERYTMRSATIETLLRENTYTDDYVGVVSKIPVGIGSWAIGFNFRVS